jgi:hypothetical protein
MALLPCYPVVVCCCCCYFFLLNSQLLTIPPLASQVTFSDLSVIIYAKLLILQMTKSEQDFSSLSFRCTRRLAERCNLLRLRQVTVHVGITSA